MLILLFLLCIFLNFFSVPKLEVYITPARAYAVDIEPYSLHCFAGAPEGNVLLKTFFWSEDGVALTDDGVNTLIDDANTSSSHSSSELVTTRELAHTYNYNCTVSMMVPVGLEVSKTATARVTVKGT